MSERYLCLAALTVLLAACQHASLLTVLADPEKPQTRPAALAAASLRTVTMNGIDVPFGFVSPAVAEIPETRKPQVRTTAYIVRLANEDTSAAAVPLLDAKGDPLGVGVSHADYCNGAVEGTIWVKRKTGAVTRFNHDKLIAKRSADCSDIFETVNKSNPKKVANWGRIAFGLIQSSTPFGTGAAVAATPCAGARHGSLFRLIPHRSIAVDPAIIPIGSLVYVPRLVGTRVRLFDGQEFAHDGFLLAADTGSSVRGAHIDYFLGPSPNDNILSSIATDENHLITLNLPNDPVILASLCSLHVDFR